MKLTKAQFCDAVEAVEKMLKQETAILDLLNINPEWVPGGWINTYYDFLTDLCELEKDPQLGTDLDWFCFDTNFGNYSDMCKVVVDGKTWTIDTPEILYDFITRDE